MVELLLQMITVEKGTPPSRPQTKIDAVEWRPPTPKSASESEPAPFLGRVKFWNLEKRFGIVTRPNDSDLYLNLAAIDTAPTAGEIISILEIDQTAARGPRITKALTERAKKGQDFLNQFTTQTLEQAFVKTPIDHMDFSSLSGTLSYTNQDGQHFTIKFSRRDLNGQIRKRPNHFYIPDPQQYPEKYVRTQSEDAEAEVWELIDAGLLLAPDRLDEIYGEKNRHEKAQVLSEQLEDPDYLATLHTYLQNYLDQGNTLRPSFAERLFSDGHTQITAQVKEAQPTYDTSQRRFNATTTIEFTIQVGTAQASRMAEVTLHDVIPEYVGTVAFSPRLDPHAVRELLPDFTADGKLRVKYNVMGEEVVLEHTIEALTTSVESRPDLNHATVVVSFTLTTPLGKRTYTLKVYHRNLYSIHNADIDTSSQLPHIQAALREHKTQVDHEINTILLIEARKMVQNVPEFLAPTEENTRFELSHYPLTSGKEALTPYQEAWLDALSPIVRMKAPFLDRGTGEQKTLLITHLPKPRNMFTPEPETDVLNGYLHQLEGSLFDLGKILDQMDSATLTQLCSEFPGLEHIKNQQLRTAYFAQIIALLKDQWKRISQPTPLFDETALADLVPAGITPETLQRASRLKDNRLEQPTKDSLELPYTYRGIPCKIANFYFKEVRSSDPGPVCYRVFNESDGVLTNPDGSAQVFLPSQLHIARSSSVRQHQPVEQDTPCFTVPLIDANGEPIVDENGNIIRCTVYLALVSSSWEGDDRPRGRGDSNIRTATDQYLFIRQPEGIQLGLAVDTSPNEYDDESYQDQMWQTLATAPILSPYREAIAAQNLDQLLQQIPEFNTSLDTTEKISQVLLLIQHLLNQVDPQNQRDWGYKPGDWDKSLEAKRKDLTIQITALLANELKYVASSVENLLAHTLTAIKEKLSVDALRSQGYVVNELIDLPPTSPDRRVILEYLDQNGALITGKDITTSGRPQKFYKQIPPRAFPVVLELITSGGKTTEIRLFMGNQTEKTLSPAAQSQIESLLTTKLFRSRLAFEAELLAFNITLSSFQHAITTSLEKGLGDIVLTHHQDGNTILTIDQQEVAVETTSFEPQPPISKDELLLLCTNLEMQLASSPVAKAQVRNIATQLRSDFESHDFSAIHTVLVHLARENGYTVTEDDYEERPTRPRQAGRLSLVRSGLLGILPDDDDEGDDDYNTFQQLTPVPTPLPTPPTLERTPDPTRADIFNTLLAKDIPNLLDFMKKNEKANSLNWRLAVAAIANKGTKGKETVRGLLLNAQQMKEIDITLKKMIKEAENTNRVDLDTLKEMVSIVSSVFYGS